MNQTQQFKVLFLLTMYAGDEVHNLFSPMLDKCCQAIDAGDVETSAAMLSFLADKAIQVTELT